MIRRHYLSSLVLLILFQKEFFVIAFSEFCVTSIQVDEEDHHPSEDYEYEHHFPDMTLETSPGTCFASRTWHQIEEDFHETLSSIPHDDDSSLDDGLDIKNTGSILFEAGIKTFVKCEEFYFHRFYVVTDTEKPILQGCPSQEELPFELEMDSNDCSTTTNQVFTTLVVTDNCGVRKAIQNGDPDEEYVPTLIEDVTLEGSVLGGGTIQTTSYMYEDLEGNNVECVVSFLAVDKQAPEIQCPLTQVVEADNCNSATSYKPPEPTGITDNCGIIDLVVSSDLPSDNVFPIGTNTYSYTVTDASGNSASCSFEIIVEDTSEPIVTCPNSAIGDGGVCDKSLGLETDPALENDPGICGKVVNYDTDLGGNTFSLDDTRQCGDDGICTSLSIESGSFFPVGAATTVTYAATDSEGNADSCSFDIEIRDVEPPVITDCPRNVQISTPDGDETCRARIEYCTPTAFDNCPGELTVTSTASTNNRVCGIMEDEDVRSGDTLPVGNTTITHTVTDQFGNTASCEQMIEVIDTEPPDFGNDGCPEDIELSAMSDCAASIMYATPTATDNCNELGGNVAIENLTPEYRPGAKVPHGIHQVRWSATDLSGNVAFCEFTVTITDDEALDAGLIDCDTPGIVRLGRAAAFSPQYPIKNNGCPVTTKLSCPTCQLCTYEGLSYDLIASSDCEVDVGSDGTVSIAQPGDIGTFISIQVEATDLEQNTVQGTCTVCVDNAGPPANRHLDVFDDDGDQRRVGRSLGNNRTRRRGERSLGSGKGSNRFYDDCNTPVLDSTEFLGSTSQCNYGSGGHGKGGKGNYQYTCPSSWDPLNNQFVCQSNCEDDIAV